MALIRGMHKTWELTDTLAWAVVYGSNVPPSVESLWDTEHGADKRARELNSATETSPWHTLVWQVRHEYGD